jgi:hypothetical protein
MAEGEGQENVIALVLQTRDNDAREKRDGAVLGRGSSALPRLDGY